MPIKRSAYKELRKAKKRHVRNIALKSNLKTMIRTFEKLVEQKKSDESKVFLKKVISKLNQASSKGILHKNAASRNISRLTKKLNSLSKA